MNKYTQRIFNNLKVNEGKLVSYGFTRKNGTYAYTADIMDGQFTLTVRINGADIDADVTDVATNEQYALFLADNAVGSFVGAVRTAYESALTDIAAKCFERHVFKSEQAQAVIRYVSKDYNDELEYLWDKFPYNAIWRRKDNKKWYGLLVTVGKNKLGLNSTEKVEALVIRHDEDKIPSVVDNVKIHHGYHMNKKHWITICLDHSADIETIFALLDNSYKLAK